MLQLQHRWGEYEAACVITCACRESRKWVEMTTLHWYKDTSAKLNTAATLLDEGPIREAMANLVKVVRESNAYGIPLRVAESNTISDSGRRNVSDVFASALWAIDASFETAAAGSVGINFHQGSGQNLYSAFVPTRRPGPPTPRVRRRGR